MLSFLINSIFLLFSTTFFNNFSSSYLLTGCNNISSSFILSPGCGDLLFSFELQPLANTFLGVTFIVAGVVFSPDAVEP